MVDLPEPVGPVTSTSPRGLLANSATTAREAERLERRDLERDQAKGRADRRALKVGVDTEARGRGSGRRSRAASCSRASVAASWRGSSRRSPACRSGSARDIPRSASAVRARAPSAGPGGDVQVGGAAVDDLEQDLGEVKIHRDSSISAAGRLDRIRASIGSSAGSRHAGDLGHRRESGLDLVQTVLAQPAHLLPARRRPRFDRPGRAAASSARISSDIVITS